MSRFEITYMKFREIHTQKTHLFLLGMMPLSTS